MSGGRDNGGQHVDGLAYLEDGCVSQMAAYDQLPKLCRLQLSFAVTPWDTREALTHYRAGYSARELQRIYRNADRDFIARAEAERAGTEGI